MVPATTSPTTRGCDHLQDLLVVVTVSAAVNLAVGWVVSTYDQRPLSALVLNFSVTWLVLLFMGLAAWLVIGLPLAKLTGNRARGWFSSALILIPIGVLSPLARAAFATPLLSVQLLVYIALLAALGVAVICGLVLSRAGGKDSIFTPVIRVGAVLLSIAGTVVLWLLATRLEILDDTSGLPSGPAITLLVALSVFGILLILGLRLVDCRPWAGRFLAVLSVFIVLAPGVSPLFERIVRRPRPAETESTTGPKQVLLITVDTLRADFLRESSDDQVPTPGIDGLRLQSTDFVNARTPAPWTRPAVASILTGVSPTVHMTIARDSRLPSELLTLAEILSNSGFTTAAIGRNGTIGAGLNFDQGFSEYRFFLTNEAERPASLGIDFLVALGVLNFAPSSSDLGDMAVEWFREHSREPFFLWVHFLDPHGPYDPPQAFRPVSENPVKFANGFGGVDSIRGGYLVPTDKEWQEIRDLYRGEISYVDEQIGKMLESLRDLQIFESATIVLTSDHGEEFREHGSAGHGHTLYDEILRVPLMIKRPEQHVSRNVRRAVSTVSVTPTILSILDLDTGDYPFQAPSLDWAWEDQSNQPQQPVISTGLLYFDNRSSVVLNGFKYIESVPGEVSELYDLARDPQEQSPLDSSVQQTAEQMVIHLQEHQEQSLAIRKSLGLTGADSVEMSPQLEKELKALGYIQ